MVACKGGLVTKGPESCLSMKIFVDKPYPNVLYIKVLLCQN